MLTFLEKTSAVRVLPIVCSFTEQVKQGKYIYIYIFFIMFGILLKWFSNQSKVCTSRDKLNAQNVNCF